MAENHLDGRTLRHRTARERAALGKEARAAVPRSSHVEFSPGPERPDPLEIIERQSATRLPELVPIRYGRMSESPFRFYRGAAAIMASDLADTPRTGLRAQLCGDAHMLNFRLLASPERLPCSTSTTSTRRCPALGSGTSSGWPPASSSCGRENGFSTKERAKIVRATVRSYRESMRAFAGIGNLAVWYAQFDEAWVQGRFGADLSARGRERWAQAVTKARAHDTVQVFDKLTTIVDGKRRITPDPPLITPLEDLLPDASRERLEQQITRLMERYGKTLQSDRRFLLEQYRVADMARKVVGVGSVGTRCWIVLLLGRDGKDPLFLQAKEADESVLAPHAGPSAYPTQGERVVSGQRLMQATSDIFLGWERVDGIDGRRRDFYVRQLRDWKWVAVAEEMVPRGMRTFGALCGATLARAHARSGDRIAIAAYLGGGDSFDRALVTFAERYADQNERDHQALVDAIKAGRLRAEAA